MFVDCSFPKLVMEQSSSLYGLGEKKRMGRSPSLTEARFYRMLVMICDRNTTIHPAADNRRVEHTKTQKLQAESKEAMRNRGASSPDRADAVFGAMTCQTSGAITLETLKGICFGDPSPRLLPAEPVTFGDSPDEYV
jgi:hypothetical protein